MYYHSINGQKDKYLSINNRGLAYGDGVFTTAKVVDGKVQLLSSHINRLTESCNKLSITLPDMERVFDELTHVAQRFPLSVAKVIITVGDGGRGYSRQGCLTSNVIISFHAVPEHYTCWQKQGVYLGLSSLKLGISPLTSGIKHLNRLEQVLIRQELDNRDEDDLLVLNYLEEVVEASAANIFWLKNNIWYTPEISGSGVAGLMRAHTLQTLKTNNHYQVEIVTEKLLALENIEAMFLCNSVMGIVPVKQFQQQILALKPSLTIAQCVQDVI